VLPVTPMAKIDKRALSALAVSLEIQLAKAQVS
jgi:hypothetical protein